jgi:hypothetical protein
MIFVRIENLAVVAVGDESTDTMSGSWQSRWDWKDLASAEYIAAQVTKLTGQLHVGTDSGPCCFPRFDVVRAPAVGDKVSYAFNGDSYPDGEIAKVSPTLQVTTSTGHVYRRRKLSGNWVRTGGTWSLVQGHHYEQNPSF